ncbi:cytochrome P450 [Thamnocephalis sphaerospora]|uniref:Cytochrome P450 n=1 Tax=Thamnocephalis sphaerospora TaxID=78915 RepID=A0A4P9XM45_9FUNG|nr:cytochrome P450 [Thamnocephalis sphaerospora]|eukprot:RKP06431.1 cytochrome P450 [Thamnocephalis sphaerospora]
MAVLLFAYWLSGAIKRKSSTTLRYIPGPWLAPFSRIFSIINIFTCKQVHRYRNWHETYGPMVRVGPRSVSVTDPAAVRQIYGSHAFRKTRMYDAFVVLGENVFGSRDPEFHKRRKRLVAPAYGQTTLAAIEPLIWRAGVESLMEKLERQAAAGQVSNLFQEFMFMTFDVVGEVAFGRSFDMLRRDGHPILKWLEDFSRMNMFRIMFPFLQRVRLPWLFGHWYESERRLYAFTRDAVERRKREKQPRRDALQMLLEAVDEDTGDSMTDAEIMPEMLVQIVAGTDTTSITLSWCVYLLSQHPEIYAKLREEIDAVLPEREATVSYATVNKLPWLDAVLNETLRLYPAVADGLPRSVPKGGAELGGHHLPGGTVVFCSAYAMHRSSALWDEPESFRPERWFAPAEKLAEMKKAFIPFSAGPRACLGRSLAWLELKLALSTLVRRFEFEHVPGARMEPIYKFMLTPMDHHVDMRLRPRT